MRKISFSISLLLISVLFISCGVSERTAQPASDSSGSAKVSEPHEAPTAISVPGYKEVQGSLEQAYRKWKGTPYVLGGTSSRGIDCSAFMQILFDNYFGIDLPRNTGRQLRVGSSVPKDALITGDLVFFKTGSKTMHVGVIIWEGEFLHASTSQGVTTSKLDDYYWKSRYMGARRVMQWQ